MVAPPNEHSAFVRPTLSLSTLDRYIVRSSILRELQAELPSFNGTVLDVGCGQMPYRSLLLSPPSKAVKYIGLDMPTDRYGTKPDLLWDGQRIPLDDANVDCALATEVFEHCPMPAATMGEICRVLRPSGFVFFTVPFLWPLHEVPYDEYRYTPFSLQRLLNQAGFSDITIRALGGWDASLAQLLGLWARRRPMAAWKRNVVSRAILPIMRWLLGKDEIPTHFGESTMVSGLCGIAHK